jgi:hypothetical protein
MDDRLDALLREVTDEVAFPPTPDLRGPVLARIARPERRGWMPAAWPRATVLAVISLLALAGTVAALALLLPGLRLTFVSSPPTASVPEGPLAIRLALGAPIAAETVDVGVPQVLGIPDEAYVLGDQEVLSLVYHARDGLPELGNSGIGLLVQVIDGAVDSTQVEKLVVEVGASVVAVSIGDDPGFWVSGPPHLIRYTAPSGVERSEATRLVGDTLVWQHGDVLYRIESGLGLPATLRIAESIGVGD